MGQQQLLLIVIGMIVVGVAVVYGLQVTGQQFQKHTADNLTERGFAIATSAVNWKMKSDPFAGGEASYSNLSFNNLGLSPTTATGTFSFTHARDDELQITAVSNRYEEIGVRIYVNDYSIDSTAVAFDGSITIE